MCQEFCVRRRQRGLLVLICIFVLLDLGMNFLIFCCLQSGWLLTLKYLLLGGFLYLAYSRWIAPLVSKRHWRIIQDQISSMSFLERINHVLISHLDFQQSFPHLLAELGQRVPFEQCLIFLVDEVTGHYQPYSRFTSGAFLEVEKEELPLSGSLIEAVVITRKAQIDQDPQWKEADERFWLKGIRSVIQVPLLYQEKMIGVLVLSSLVPDQYTQTELNILIPVAERLACALQNSLLYQETRDLTLKDYLTDTANRRALDIRLDYEYRRAKRYHQPFSILVVDIDHFKPFNDRYGHLAGDQALCELALLMKEQVREIDLVSRFGGEEFVILLPETNREQAGSVAERIRQNIADKIFLEGTINAQLTVCIGVATYTDDMDGVRELLQGADLKLYCAKSGGRNQVVQMN